MAKKGKSKTIVRYARPGKARKSHGGRRGGASSGKTFVKYAAGTGFVYGYLETTQAAMIQKVPTFKDAGPAATLGAAFYFFGKKPWTRGAAGGLLAIGGYNLGKATAAKKGGAAEGDFRRREGARGSVAGQVDVE